MDFGIYLLLAGLIGVYIALHLYARAVLPKPVSVTNPNFHVFQRAYLIPYLLATLADWLQAPYLYQLYRYYGFIEFQIAAIYVVGFISTVIASTLASTLVHKTKRKQCVLALTVINIISCFTKLSRSYSVLLVGRVLAGFSITLLFSFYQEWYVYQHHEAHGFPEEWIELTFSKAAFWNGVLAISCGLMAHLVADTDTFNMTPVAPFMLAIPLLLLSAFIIKSNWEENQGKTAVKFRTICIEGLKDIITNKCVFLLATVQSVFEGALYIYVFLWTPVLTPIGSPPPPLGVIFSLFMVCIVIGSPLQSLLVNKLGLAIETVPVLICSMGVVSSSILAYSTHPDHISWELSLFGILLFELACGIHIPSVNRLQSVVFKDNTMGVANWVRVPMNIIACACLMSLHGASDTNGSHLLFQVCRVLLCVGLIFALLLKFAIASDAANTNGAAGNDTKTAAFSDVSEA